MRSTGLFILFIITLFPAITRDAKANQIVSEESREWARKAILEEKSLGAATAPNTIAVLYFRNSSGEKELAPLRKGLALMLITDLSTVKNLQVVERIKLQALDEELGLGKAGITEPGTAPRFGRLLGARWLVGGDFAGGQTILRIRSELLDIPSDTTIGRSETAGALAELFRMEKDLLFGIIEQLKIEVTPDEEARLKMPCSTNTAALLALFRGVDAGDNGEYEKAAEFYKKALREDPQVCMAADALNELESLGLVPSKKKSGELLRSLRDRTSLTNQLTPKEELRSVRTPNDVPTDVDVNLIFP